jgi:lysozyme family protein
MANFAAYLPLLQQAEGGFQKLPSDPGNYNSRGELVGTNHGISARFYEDVIKRPPTEADMRAITKATAEPIFKTYFWDKVQADNIKNQSVANTVVDHHVNAGRGVKLAQEVLNSRFGFSLAVDNSMGPKTLAALNQANPAQFVAIYNEARADYYKSIGNSTFLSGWLTRLKKFAYANPGTTISVGALILISGFFLRFIN